MKSGIIRDNNQLEALRGFAAVFVVIQHITVDRIDTGYMSPVLQAFRTPGNLCVLIFFMLSGYVIGMSNRVNLIPATIVSYLKKRFVRIYPIYVISLLLALWVATRHYSGYTIFCNFALLQDLLSHVIEENGPVWSLHYEVLYYLLFIPISYFKVNPYLVFVGSIILSFVNYFLYPHVGAPIITAYLAGFSFWMLGLILAQKFTSKEREARPSLLLSYIFLLLAMQVYHVQSTLVSSLSMAVFKHLLVFSHSFYWAVTKIGFGDLAFLPFCFIFIAVFSNIKFKYKQLLMLVLHLVPLLSLITLKKVYSAQTKYEIIVCSTYYAMSLLLFFTKSSLINGISRKLILMANWLGSLSYGIYVIHFPILIFFGKVLWFSGTTGTFLVRLIIFAIFVLVISYLLEKKYQPWVKRFFFK